VSRISRVPGNIANQTTGKNYLLEKGWRQFFFTDPRCVVEPGTAQPLSGAPVETTGNTVFTFNQNYDGGTEFAIDGYVAGMPLRTAEGDVVTFGKPFVLKTMIELISISGDYDSVADTDATQAVLSMGICENASDYDADDNRHLGSGCRLMCRLSEVVEEDVFDTIDSLDSSGSPPGQITTASTACNGSDNPKLFVSEFFVGPDMATANGNTFLQRQAFKASGNSYATPVNALHVKSFNDVQGFDSDGTIVTFYAAVHDMETDAFSGNTACVLTARFWYMVEADVKVGWGGSGSA